MCIKMRYIAIQGIMRNHCGVTRLRDRHNARDGKTIYINKNKELNHNNLPTFIP